MMRVDESSLSIDRAERVSSPVDDATVESFQERLSPDQVGRLHAQTIHASRERTFIEESS